MGRSATHASASGAQIILSEEDFALSMVQSRHHHAALMDAEINLSMEEYVRGTELWSSDAEWKAAEIKLSKGGCVFGMGQDQTARSNYAAERDAQIELRLEEFV